MTNQIDGDGINLMKSGTRPIKLYVFAGESTKVGRSMTGIILKIWQRNCNQG